MRRTLLLAVFLSALPACGMSHGMDDDAGSAGVDGGPGPGDLDAACECDADLRADSGPTVYADAGLYRVDATGRDGGPPGDRLGDDWEGYIEATTFPSGSDAIRIHFDSHPPGDGPRTGVVILGEGVPPPPPTDAWAGYPPGFDLDRPDPIAEGFEYPIVEASVVGDRVRATFQLGALWADWCALQTPYPLGDGYRCVPNTGTRHSEAGCALLIADGEAPVDCAWLRLCDDPNVCSCTADGCVAGTGATITIDFHVTGTSGDGTVLLPDRRNIHLMER